MKRILLFSAIFVLAIASCRKIEVDGESTSNANPNSGTDAVTLHNGWQLLVYNPLLAGKEWWEGRSVLRVALSADGINWKDAFTLEDHREGEYSYPAVIQTKDGVIHITYTHARSRIRHVQLKLNKTLKQSKSE